MAMTAPHPSARPHYMMTFPPPPPNGYAAAVPAGMQPPSLGPQALRPLPAAAAGFEYLHQPILHPPDPSTPFSDPAMAMYRYSAAERMAAMDRANSAMAPQLGYPYYPAPLPLPTPPQAALITNTKNFPETLFDVLSRKEYGHIISWLPHGRGFVIHDKNRFADMILPRYFDGAKYTSFTRRLKRWNFARVSRGPELGAYYNKMFKRGDPELVQKMIYKMEGQFEEGKKKTAGKNEDDRKMEVESIQEAVRVESLPKKKKAKKGKSPSLASRVPSSNPNAAQAKAKSPSLMSFEQKILQQTPIVHTNAPTALPLPSMLSKRSKNCKKVPPMVHVSLQSASHKTAAPPFVMATNPSSLQKVAPQSIELNDHGDRCLMEAQRELLLARSMRARDDAAGIPAGPLGSASNIPRFRMGGCGMTPVDRAERIESILEAERTLGLTGHPSAATPVPNHDLVRSSIKRGEIMPPTVTDLQMRLAPPYVKVSHHPSQMFPSQESIVSRSAILQREQPSQALSVSYNHLPNIPPRQLGGNELGPPHAVSLGADIGTQGRRAIMMSQEEEDEFASFLVSKRKGGLAV